jgi:tRNA(Ile)-lysidine synthase
MLERFNRFIADKKLLNLNDKFLLALSGGIDSMVLAHLLWKGGFNFEAAHCNFQLRGDESDTDESFVKQWCAEHNVVVHTKRFRLNLNENVQQAARDSRYQWFFELMSDYGFTKLLTAHHASDNVETLFINLLRGTGHKGWAGIPLTANRMERPLLFATKLELEAFAKNEGILFRSDQSNLSDKYLRNKIRHNILPELQKINPSAERLIAQSQLQLQSSNLLLKELIEKVNSNYLIKTKGGTLVIHHHQLKPASQSALVLFELLQEFGFQWWQIEAVYNATQGGGLLYSTTHQLLIGMEQLQIRPLSENRNKNESAFIFPEQKSIETPIHLAWEIVSAENQIISKDAGIASLDFDKLQFPLQVRKWQIGDRFRPIGMKGSKLLSDYFTDLKLNNFEKEQVYVLETGESIAWVVGYRPDDHFKVTSATKKMFLIQVNR